VDMHLSTAVCYHLNELLDWITGLHGVQGLTNGLLPMRALCSGGRVIALSIHFFADIKWVVWAN